MRDPLPLGATIGILGGGQLARMLALAAARLGLRCAIYDPSPDAPGFDVTPYQHIAAWDDVTALSDFARYVDVVTFEFENIPAEALNTIEPLCAIYPQRRALEVSQDRLSEKEFLKSIGLEVAPFVAINNAHEIHTGLSELRGAAILKTRRFGYDGKGQVRLEGSASPEQAWEAIQQAPALLEALVPFEREISVIGARSKTGQIACFDPAENEHRNGILHRSTIPARITSAQRTDAVLVAARLLNALDYVGVLGLELFVTQEGLIVNEFAPRVHNSGHWTQDGCVVDQFEQHIRAIAGWPLGDGKRFRDIEMTNLLGEDITRVHDLARDPTAALHIYGKAQSRPGRKMGHVNRALDAAQSNK